MSSYTLYQDNFGLGPQRVTGHAFLACEDIWKNVNKIEKILILLTPITPLVSINERIGDTVDTVN